MFGASLTCSLVTGTCTLSGPIVIPISGTKRQVPPDEAFLHGPELRFVGLDVEVDLLEPADPLTVHVHEVPAAPLGDLAVHHRRLGHLRLGHRGLGVVLRLRRDRLVGGLGGSVVSVSEA